MKPEEAKDILSDMRDQHLCFLESSESKDEWQKNYLKEAWACDFGAKSLEKQIPRKPIDKTKPDDTASLAYENCNIVVCPTCGGRLKLKSKGKYCDKCGQKLDWGENHDNNTCCTCIDIEDGFCDRKGILVEDDDSCDKHREANKEVR